MKYTPALLLLTTLAACGRAPEPQPEPTRAAATPTPAPTPSAIGAATDLSRYVGQYPFDPVAGGRFIDEPAVRAAVARVVPDADVRDTVLSRDATANPVAEQDGRILSWACEAHNCGPHNWAIAITSDGRDAAVCYHDQDAGVSRWYPADYRSASPDGCPSGE
ncbi:hypothetical protein HRV97_09230 [Sphingomonas sp. HHU CXW]|uniref:Inhibitor of lysozyme (Ivy) n=1 Tax=Sphingomonas hominis TaxID=2741495 RepID=A0ABX2JHW5_9SPHN|nr:hypothetical protein [Sphingomonas hominis]NTS65344.1 hypothetical protein [Sphingomonas hominis]